MKEATGEVSMTVITIVLFSSSIRNWYVPIW